MKEIVSAQVQEAIKRGVIGGFVSLIFYGLIMAGAAYFGALQAGRVDREAYIAAGVAFFGFLVARVVEGRFDAARQERGDVIPSDVTPIPKG